MVGEEREGDTIKTMTQNTATLRGQKIQPSIRYGFITVAGLAGALSAWAGGTYGAWWVLMLVTSITTSVVAIYGASTKQTWGKRAIGSQIAVGLATTAGAAVLDGWYAVIIGVAGAIGWFAARTMYSYLKPALEVSGEVLHRIEQHIQLSGESLAGVRMGVRVSDGTVIGVAVAGEVRGEVSKDQSVAKAIQDARNAREILRKNNGIEAAMLCVAEGTFSTQTIDGVVVCNLQSLPSAVGSIPGASVKDIAAMAAAGGVNLNRNQLRTIDKHQGRKTGGKKIVHRGRVTKVEP